MSENTKQAFMDIQDAVYLLLNGEISVPIYDTVPTNPPKKYVTFADQASAPFEARGVAGRAVTLILSIFTRDQGGKYPAYQIMDEIIALMTPAKLPMTNFAEIQKTVGPTIVERMDKEPGSFQGILPFLFLVAEK